MIGAIALTDWFPCNGRDTDGQSAQWGKLTRFAGTIGLSGQSARFAA